LDHIKILIRRSCKNGYLEIVKYLIGLDGKIDIHSDDEYAFEWSCICGRIEIIKYLMTLYPGYNYKIDKKIIPIIKSIKEIEIERILKFGKKILNYKYDLIIKV